MMLQNPIRRVATLILTAALAALREAGVDALAKAAAADKTRVTMFDKVNGSPEVRTYLTEGKDLGELFAKWRQQCAAFKEARKKFLLY